MKIGTNAGTTNPQTRGNIKKTSSTLTWPGIEPVTSETRRFSSRNHGNRPSHLTVVKRATVRRSLVQVKSLTCTVEFFTYLYFIIIISVLLYRPIR